MPSAMALDSPSSLCDVVCGKGQTLPRGFDGAINVRFRVCRGNESGLKLGRREKNSTVEHFAEIPRIAFGVRRFRVLVIANRLVGEEHSGKRIVGIHLSR